MTAPFSPDDPVRAALEKAIGFQYEIVRLLGRGGMGAVYHAHERALDRPVAIKVLPPDVAGTPEGRERFLREARTAARLTHPNIVPLFTFGETGGLIYYVMGYVDGESLEQRLRRAGKLDPAEASRILEQLSNALDYAHQQGIVHRDVKPDNVLIERETGVAKLTDFGIAKRAAAGETLTGTGLLLGTPRYMSPEQAAGDRDLDARSDVYSLGLVGYAMLAGRPPFDGASVQEILTQQVTRDAPSLRKVLPDLPSPIANAVERALAKNPKDRWPTAAALGSALSDEEEEETGGSWGRRMRRPGTYAFYWLASFGLLFNAAWWIALMGSEPDYVLLAVLVLYPVSTFADYAAARWKDRRTPAELRRVFTEPPRWWPFWWPARFRRPDDVWSRLPQHVRTTRGLSSAAVYMFAAGMEIVFLLLTARDRIGDDTGPPIVAIVGLITIFTLLAGSLAAFATSAVRSWRWGRKHGLSMDESALIHSEPTARLQFWSKPKYARFLSPPHGSVASTEPRSVKDIAAAIGEVVRQLPEAHRGAVGDAAAASRQLVSAIDALDDEIARLAREADPAEIERLESRLASIGPTSEMRKLYESQLDLLRRLARQSADLASRRARYVELLRTLWLQVSALRAEQAADSMQAGDVTGRIRDLCRSVQHEVDGAREAGRLLLERR